MSSAARRPARVEEFWSIPEGERFHEFLAGSIVEKSAPSGEHGDAQAGLVGLIRPRFQRKPGRGGPGGWWIATEVEVELASGEIVRPDVLGWRRETSPERPTGTPVRVRPDWIAEVVSPTHANDDTIKKLRIYQAAGVSYYWIVDPRDATLTVMRWSADGYVTLLRAERGERVRAEPFSDFELAVGTLFGDDPEE